MREIRFRAWDKVNKKMYEVEKLYFENKTLTHVGIDCEGLEGTFQVISVNHIELMQYTGLKDKNSKEIYEGDIVKSFDGHIYQVIWSENGFKFLFKFNIRGCDEKNILNLGDTSSKRWGVEVIGNIYENSDLTK